MCIVFVFFNVRTWGLRILHSLSQSLIKRLTSFRFFTIIFHHHGLLIPSSSPHIFHERNLHVCKRNLEEYLFYICDKISNECFPEVPRYYDKEVQFVISLNMWHLENTMVFLLPKCVISKR